MGEDWCARAKTWHLRSFCAIFPANSAIHLSQPALIVCLSTMPATEVHATLSQLQLLIVSQWLKSHFVCEIQRYRHMKSASLDVHWWLLRYRHMFIQVQRLVHLSHSYLVLSKGVIGSEYQCLSAEEFLPEGKSNSVHCATHRQVHLKLNFLCALVGCLTHYAVALTMCSAMRCWASWEESVRNIIGVHGGENLRFLCVAYFVDAPLFIKFMNFCSKCLRMSRKIIHSFSIFTSFSRLFFPLRVRIPRVFPITTMGQSKKRCVWSTNDSSLSLLSRVRGRRSIDLSTQRVNVAVQFIWTSSTEWNWIFNL